MYSMKSELIVVCLFGLLSLSFSAIPDYIHTCEKKDPDLARCIIDSINTLRPKLKEGIPELDVPGLEPLELDVIKLRNGITANVTDLKVTGGSAFEILELNPNIPKNRFAFVVSLPFLSFTGNYELDSKLLLLQLRGKGPIHGNFSDYTFSAALKGKRIKNNGNTYLKFDDLKIKIGLGKTVMKLENLFNGNPTLGQVANSVLNESNELILNEIRPVLEVSLAEKFLEIANKITLRFTFDELFL